MQGNTVSSGRIHVQWSFCEFACALNSDWLKVDFWIHGPVVEDTLHSRRPINNSLSQYNVSAATGICIRKSTFNQSELGKRTRKFAEWPLDMYLSIGHISPCIEYEKLLHFTPTKEQTDFIFTIGCHDKMTKDFFSSIPMRLTCKLKTSIYCKTYLFSQLLIFVFCRWNVILRW